MGTIVICEKPDQARDVRAAIGSRYGRVMNAEGHLLRLQTPNEVKPSEWGVKWSVWKPEAMLPEQGVYGFAVADNPRRAKLFGEIAAALKGADAVVIATDPDREGQSIGDEILDFAGFRGRVKRAIYNNTDEITLNKVFSELKDNALFRTQYYAARARQNVDQLFGMSLTRTVTREFVRLGWRGRVVKGKATQKIGVGRVRSPIWGMLCQRELEILEFQPKDYFDLSLDVACQQGKVKLWYRPAGEDRIFDKGVADAVLRSITGFSGPLAVVQENKQQQAPRPPDLPTLQKRASSLWRWKAKYTLSVIQSLYNTHKIATYPRAETRYLPEVMIKDVPDILAGIKKIPAFSNYGLEKPNVRTGKSGVFSDKALENISHHAVIPNVSKMGELETIYPQLSADERKMFDLICGYYVASLDQPYRFKKTQMSVVVERRTFKASGNVVIDAGWRQPFALGGDNPGEADDKDAESNLPPIPDGTVVQEAGTNIAAKKTTPPSRYTDGSIIDAMQNVWKRVEDRELQAKLKETNGLGTPATRDSFIYELEQDSLVETARNGQVVPTKDGLKLFKILSGVCPRLFDPASTASLEIMLDDVQHGRAKMEDVIAQAARLTNELISDILSVTTQSSVLFRSPPSEKMLSAVESAARAGNLSVPDAVRTDYAACRAWLQEHIGDGPSPAQIELAKKIQADTAIDLPGDVLKDRKALSDWLDKGMKVAAQKRKESMGQEPASPKQIECIQKIIGSGYIPEPEGWPNITKLQASEIIGAHKGTDNKSGGKGGKGARQRRAPAGKRRSS
ncbi:DNA topoisomerase III [Acetobacter malorum DSM 14337]|uniref:DNA topoisomerase n=1 Tax=Acetobacter malorum DSM 14337 TaxID=1307910 RepID=A0ABQ0PKR3_9PROT|nr:DNA topoisomerase [Acetobacter malorum]GBQ74752.1 DNA topoisomerase III [Acetobacter malorum DSM 14337]